MRNLVHEISARLRIPHEVRVRIPTLEYPLDIAVPSARRIMIAVKLIGPPQREGTAVFPFGRKRLLAQMVMMVDEMFEELKGLREPVVCIAVPESADSEMLHLLEELAYVDEIVYPDACRVAQLIEKIASNPWYPTFIVMRHAGRELLGLAPLGRMIEKGRIKRETRAKGFIVIDPVTEEVYLRDIYSVLRMIVEAVNLPVSDVKLRELRFLLNSRGVYVKLRGWIKELVGRDKEELRVLLRELITIEPPEEIPELDKIRRALRVLGVNDANP